jgi:hypothetical protein
MVNNSTQFYGELLGHSQEKQIHAVHVILSFEPIRHVHAQTPAWTAGSPCREHNAWPSFD